MAPGKVKSKVPKEAAQGKVEGASEVVRPAGRDAEGRVLCCVPQGKVACVDPPIRDLAAAVRVTCSNPSCPTSRLMHAKCFAKFEDKMCAALAKIGRGRSWTNKQVRENVWAASGYLHIYKFCCCPCGHGHLRKEEVLEVEQGEEQGRGGKRRKEKVEKRPKLYCGQDKLSDKSRAEGVEDYGDWRCTGCGFVNYSCTPYSSMSAGGPDECGGCGGERGEEEEEGGESCGEDLATQESSAAEGGGGGVEAEAKRIDLNLISAGNFVVYKKEKVDKLLPSVKVKNNVNSTKKEKVNVVTNMMKMEKKQHEEEDDAADLPRVETDCEVVARRERQISHYRSSEEYQRCLELVGGREGEEGLPRTPDTTLVCSRSRWDALVNSWRQAVHQLVREEELEQERMEDQRRAEENLTREKMELEKIQKHKEELAKMEEELEQTRRELMEQESGEEKKRMEEHAREMEGSRNELVELEQVVEEARASEWMLLQEVEDLRRQLRLAEAEREQEEEKVRLLLAEQGGPEVTSGEEVEGVRGWSCVLCTFLNPGEGGVCSMCGTPCQ